MLRGDQQERQQDSTQIEVISGLSTLYHLIEQRHNLLPRDLKNKLEFNSDSSIFEDTIYDNTLDNEHSGAYDRSLSSARIPRRGRNNEFA